MELLVKQTMLAKERFCNFLYRKNLIKFFINILFLLYFNSSQGSEKLIIINNFNNLESYKFDFIQKSFGKKESGVCYLRRPYYLKCLYDDKSQKQLIINNRVLVVYHKRYSKIYRYPLSKSFFLDLLDKEKFSKLISNGKILLNDSFFEINYSDGNKGEITFFFDRNTYDLSGWRLIGIDNNITILEIKNFLKNIEINKSFFTIPEEN